MIGLIISLILLIYLIYRGFPVLIVSPLMAMLAVFMGSDIPVFYSWTGPFMDSVVSFISAYFPIFLVGAVFGTLMNASGAALTIAHFISDKMGEKRAIIAVIIASFLLTYGGISVFVVVFAVLPIARTIFIKSNYPQRLLPSAICAGCLPAYVAPGSAQFINAIPIPVFNTTIYSGLVIGIVGTAVWLLFAVWYMSAKIKNAKIKGEGYGTEVSNDCNLETGKVTLAFIPILIVIIGNAFLTYFFQIDEVVDYYRDFGGIQGTWAILISIAIAIVVTICIYWNTFKSDIKKTLTLGATESLLPIFNTSTQVGYGGVIKVLPVFTLIQTTIFSIPGVALFPAVIGTAILSGIVGSTSGGVGLVMVTFGQDLLELSQAQNISPGLMHRIIVFSASTLDTLPHSGFIITLLGVCGLSHKQSYKELFIVTCVFPAFAVLSMLVYAFLFLI
ncbi:GntP family permease [Escherichia coli]|uniref:GntP family permease n=1 Tax=Escherichia coli TaxID=562 RepID=UPI00168E6080|nr:GntP family permease [Escherichia coli]ELP2897074.1 GntP family permease [Escherichia coli O128]EEU2031273.1 GntP family permease [Escherichia coli]EEV7679290.1 GntP family permease [Escherichia coli]EFE9080541.1 GntP family permease [Escherichia coli]